VWVASSVLLFEINQTPNLNRRHRLLKLLLVTKVKPFRHPGKECRGPGYRDVQASPSLAPADSGNPCRNDAGN
ncbi:MAG: hypothetical protein ACRERS_07665, partial [Methylococcales bacterium]